MCACMKHQFYWDSNVAIWKLHEYNKFLLNLDAHSFFSQQNRELQWGLFFAPRPEGTAKFLNPCLLFVLNYTWKLRRTVRCFLIFHQIWFYLGAMCGIYFPKSWKYFYLFCFTFEESLKWCLQFLILFWNHNYFDYDVDHQLSFICVYVRRKSEKIENTLFISKCWKLGVESSTKQDDEFLITFS